ncbi:sugar phosphate isomerase/epimerase [Alginatibacterium sediminis]|uniref:Sugar phosphate isomerase/epimerase n=1 Tax=Alginatibacterium sediminis TaxID=2164068 RepID=A0A420EHY1_9ALTE|nr:sugar phosphate isomerase/epimerase family protein [Alginatibacterium sediminis]RKF20278.1 sugar phosphate isomerase/epimerase [Alginatibacterium sediminis]
MKYALISMFLGPTKDRFSTYNEPKTLDEKMEMIESMRGVSGVELVYPYEVSDVEDTKALLSRHNVEVAAINVNIKGEPEFKSGGISNPDPEVRAKAVRYIKQAKDFAQAIGADKVTCCPLSDGYEFCFQHDYVQVWEWMKEGFAEAGAYKPEIPLFIEYKPNEVRGRCVLEDASKTLLMIKEIGNPDIGVTLDYGHSLYGGNNPAEELALIHNSKVKYYIHINDNDGRWDWDYFCGSQSLVNYIEFIYYLKKYGYDDFLTSDTSPTRWDIKKMFETNARISEKISNRFDEIGMDNLSVKLSNEEYLDTWQFIEEQILRL